METESIPEYIAHRIEVWDEWEKKQKKIEAKPIKISLPDGKVVDGVAGETSPLDIASSISSGLARQTIVAKVNGSLYDCWRPLEDDCAIELIKFDEAEGKKVFWHSSSHILGQSLEKTLGAHLCIGPALKEGGFYYEAALPDDKKVSSIDDFPKIEKAMKEVAKAAQPFQRLVIPKEAALDMFKFNKYKKEIIQKKVSDGSECTVYRCGPLIDLCRGPHLPNTKLVRAVKVQKASSSYFLGDAKNDTLQRVYGLSFPTPKQLKIELRRLEEAAKRDHRVIGPAQELFFFDKVSPGSCFFLPHGTRVYNKLAEFLRAEYRKRGFSEVKSPNVFKSDLWKTSGHWQNYQDDMFLFECEKEMYGIKPMNCPAHCIMFAHRTRSWRELPLRFADFGALHRNELSGALTGLTRVRRFQQDDAHIFCRKDQIKQEISSALNFLDHVYGVFGFTFQLEFSTKPEKAMGDDKLWEIAEQQLSDVLEEYCSSSGKEWKLNVGDGAFYGPKIDIQVHDAIGRSHQCATIQLDFQLPINFDLKYQTQSDGKIDQPVIIHRAIYGSFERFIAILIEHTAGKWPFWISPRQVRVLTIADNEEQKKYAKEVADMIENAGYYVDIDISDKKINRKVREAQLAQVNYILCVGNREVTEKTVDVRTRDNKRHGTKPVEELLTEFALLCEKYE